MVQETAEKLVSLMSLQASVNTTEDAAGGHYIVNIEAGEENGLLIGRRGETLLSLQFMLSVLTKEALEEGERVLVNVGDWREKQELYLKELAHETAQRAKDTQEPQPLYNLSAAQRRIVHMELSEDNSVLTESIGEGDERYLVVKPKS